MSASRRERTSVAQAYPELASLIEVESRHHDLGSGDLAKSVVNIAHIRPSREPAAKAYAKFHAARWPSTQTSWLKHLTRLCDKIDWDGDEPVAVSKSKLRTVAKRLHIEQQGMLEIAFTLKYNRFIPDLDWKGGLPDHRLHELPGRLSGLTGQGGPAPVGLFTPAEAGDLLGITADEVRRALREPLEHFDWGDQGVPPWYASLVKVGHGDYRLEQRDIDELREQLEPQD